jgi:hypothetical protein
MQPEDRDELSALPTRDGASQQRKEDPSVVGPEDSDERPANEVSD